MSNDTEVAIRYLYYLIIKDIVEVVLIMVLVTGIVISVKALKERYRIKKQMYKFDVGYNKAIDDAVQMLNENFNDWNNDDMFATIPTQKNIIIGLENMKYDKRRKGI